MPDANPFLAPDMIAQPARPAAQPTTQPNPFAAAGMQDRPLRGYTPPGPGQQSSHPDAIHDPLGDMASDPVMPGFMRRFLTMIGVPKPEPPKNEAEAKRRTDEAFMGLALGMTGGAEIEGGIPLEGRLGPRPQAVERAGRLQDFVRAGVSPTMPAVGQGRAAGLAQKLGRALPASPVQRGMQRNLAETAASAERMAGAYGPAPTPEAAGNITRNELNRFASDKSQAKADYARLDTLMHGAAPQPMTNTRTVLADIARRYPQAQAYVKMLEDKLTPRTKTIPPTTSPVLGPSGTPIVTAPGRTVTTGGALHWKQIRDLRSDIGAKLDAPSFGPTDIPHGEMRRLYGAVTRDMQAAARARGPAALQALQRATINYAQRMRVIERLEPLVQPNSGDGVFARINQAAQREGSSSADVPLLEAAKKVMGPEWGNVGAAMIRRMGSPTPGAPRVPGEPEFSIASFATNWNRLSARAKDTIFGDDRPGSNRAALESLARVANMQRNVLHLAGQSPTGEANAMMAAAAAVIDGILRGGHSPELVGSALGVGGSYGLAKLMMSPRFTKWWYGLPKMLNQGTTPQRAASLFLKSAIGSGALQESEPPKAKPQRPPRPKVGDRTERGGTVTGTGAGAL